MTASPLDDIKALIARLPPAGPGGAPPDAALGRLGAIGAQLSRWSPGGKPRVLRPIVALYAGSHGEGEAAALRERLELIAAGGAPINALVQAAGAGLEAFDLAVERPVGDIAVGAAMSERECAATMAFGMEALAKQPDLLVVGDIVTGAPVGPPAIALALYGGEAADWTAQNPDRAALAVARLHAETGAPPQPLEILRQLGGREIAAIAGAILAARSQGVPVLIDGYGAAAAAAVLHAVDPEAIAHVLAADRSPEPGHGRLLAHLKLNPILNLGTAGEGCGAAAAIGIVRLACELA